MRRFSANYVFPVAGPPIKNGIVEVDSTGRVTAVVDPCGEPKETHSTEFYNGVIVPGFVNAHCHLELSHLKGRVEQNLGIAGFIKAIAEHRADDDEVIDRAIRSAVREVELTGTVAVGDICNTSDTFLVKANSSIFFHSFIEVFGANPSASRRIMEAALGLMAQLQRQGGSASITPHSTYSLSPALWERVRRHTGMDNLPISIHYAESLAEYEFLRDGTGDLLNHYRRLGIPVDTPFGLSPFAVVIGSIAPSSKVLFVHNTFAPVEELVALSGLYRRATFVACPESNLIIEGRLPDLSLMHRRGLRIAVGTDSLASATSLSMLHHMVLLQNAFPDIPFAEILRWATLNGANALNVSDRFGSIEIGKTPGLNLITNFNFSEMRLGVASTVRRLV